MFHDKATENVAAPPENFQISVRIGQDSESCVRSTRTRKSQNDFIFAKIKYYKKRFSPKENLFHFRQFVNKLNRERINV